MAVAEFYKSDNRARNMVHLAIGLYKYRDEVDGFLEQSLYWASIGFEHIIRLTARSIFRDVDGGQDLKDMINDICGCPRVNYSQRENLLRHLTALKAIRNRMFHPGGLITDRQATGMLKAVSEMVGSDFEKVREEITYEQLRQLRDRAFKIPRMPPDREILDRGEICDADFNDLEVLYEKCKFLHFKELRDLLSPLRLKPEEMSELIPTTGTIWLPWVAREPGERSHIRTIVLGANLTPSFVRIGIDFGGGAYEAKKTYYTLLLTGDLDAQLNKLDEDFYFIDTFWYNNIQNKRPIRDYYPTKPAELRKKIRTALEETIEKAKAQTPMKGHRFLIGKIFERDTKRFRDFLANPPQTIRGIFSDLHDIVRRVEDHQEGKSAPVGLARRFSSLIHGKISS